MLARIISGGQTGADRGGLDAAIALGIPHGGWCPRGRRTEDGMVPACYQLEEDASPAYASRTRRNVIESDATIVFVPGEPDGGSALTVQLAGECGRPCMVIDVRRLEDRRATLAAALRAWLAVHQVRTLNVAGSRESKAPGIAAAVAAFLGDVFVAQDRPSA